VSPGAFGWLYQSCGRSDVLLVPETAVSRIGQLESVRLVVNGEVKLRHVRTGKRHDGLVEILSGLNEGDVVQLAGGR
jgi:multidrug efflux pump subunit AcrA (membrane-fusion protein)